MTVKKALLYFVILSLAPTLCKAQLNFDFIAGKFLIKGTTVDVQTKKPIPSVNIRVLGSNKGISTDNDGDFSLYVSKTDSLKFTCTGYISKQIRMSDIDSTKYYVIQVYMLHDFIKLKDVTIYPFHDLDEFKQAFVDVAIVKPSIYGIAPPKYKHDAVNAKLYNPVSFIYERLKRKRRAANPDFKP